MNITTLTHPIPDLISVKSELDLGRIWNSEAVAELIHSKSAPGESPAFLFLGTRETGLLRGHLAQAFGEETVITLKDSYYQGLQVIPLECETFVYVGGRKVARTLQDPISRRAPWQERETAALWQFRI